MPAIGIGLLWVAYSAGLYGYSLIRGYCNTPAGLLSPVGFQPWSTTVYTGTGLIPSGCAPAAAGAASGGFAGKGGPQNVPTSSAALPEGVTAGQHGR